MTLRDTLRTRWTTRLAATLAIGLLCSIAGAATAVENAKAAVPDRIAFNRDVRPILSDNCFLCHGPDKGRRKAGLRLDLREEAIDAEGHRPGQARRERAGPRILSDEPDEVMPPPKSHRKLDARQKEILTRWVEQGAEYQRHWSYEKPVKTGESPTARTPSISSSVDGSMRSAWSRRPRPIDAP